VKEAMDADRTEGKPSIFQALLTPSEKDKEYVVPTVDELTDEAYAVLAAAAETTGNALTISAYNILSNSDIHFKLKKELDQAFPDPGQILNFLKLETLPYLVSLRKTIKMKRFIAYG
jgi:cytochrome P450